MHPRLLSVVLISLIFSLASKGQEHNTYPDSLKSIVIKFEPLSILFNQLSAGLEVPLTANKFLDITMGYGGLGMYSSEKTNGLLVKAGVKFPRKFQTPFSMIYVMPLFAYSHYTAPDYYSYPNKVNVSAQALLVDFGYRHINPETRFYYDVGFDVGYGWANNGEATQNFNHIILTNYNYTKNSVAGIALSAHFSIGVVLRKR